jgi:hypothetical protein
VHKLDNRKRYRYLRASMCELNRLSHHFMGSEPPLIMIGCGATMMVPNRTFILQKFSATESAKPSQPWLGFPHKRGFQACGVGDERRRSSYCPACFVRLRTNVAGFIISLDRWWEHALVRTAGIGGGELRRAITALA